MAFIWRRGRRAAAVSAAVGLALLASACATGALKKEGFTRPPSATAGVLMDPDIELSELSAGGVQQPKAEWSEAAEKLMTAALEEHFGKKSLALQRYQEPADAQARAAHERVVNLHRAVGLAIRAHKYPNLPSTLPTKEKSFDWTLGEGAQKLRTDLGADYALFVHVRDSYSSAERKALMIGAALLGVGIPGGVQIGFASLVDLRTGEVVWFNQTVNSMGDLREAKPTPEQLTALLDQLPL
jgi:hypothetical protein